MTIKDCRIYDYIMDYDYRELSEKQRLDSDVNYLIYSVYPMNYFNININVFKQVRK